jgi:hypothetical protein
MTTYAREHLLFTFGGHSGGGDIWQCGWRFATPSGGTISWPSGGFLLGPMFDAVKTAFNNSYISAGASFEWVKLASIGSDGNYQHDPVDFIGTAVSGQTLTLASGPQDSMCVSLWSGSTVGKGNHGRFYLPWNGVNVDRTTGRFVLSLIPPIVAAWKTAINAVKSQINNDLSATIPVDLVIMGSSTYKKVVQVRIGDVMDTQRRRRNALAEYYQSAVL